MRQARIWVDGRGYRGEDPDQTVGQHGLPNEMNLLLFGDEPCVIRSETSIRSHLERIMLQLRHGYLDAKRIEIRLEVIP